MKVGVALSLSVVVVLGALHVPAAAQPSFTTENELQIWNTSLKLVNYPDDWDGDWRLVFRRMTAAQGDEATPTPRPDIISILEVPWDMRKKVMAEVEETLGTTDATDYASVHVDAKTPYCKGIKSPSKKLVDCGNTLVAYRVARLGVECPNGSCRVMRWKQILRGSNGGCSARNPYIDQIAVRLNDLAQDRVVTFVSLHLSSKNPHCVGPSLKDMNDRLEGSDVWRDRPLTIVAGDFNEKPDQANRNEEDPACWYRSFAAHHSEDCTIDSGDEYSFPYFDLVWAKNSDSTEAICNHWTFGHNPLKQENDPDCSLSAGRIDYLWSRYEASDGTAITFDDPAAAKEYAHSQTSRSWTDRGYADTGSTNVRYSDHRALFATVFWCSPTATSATPCS
jgi:hypothetical protein